MERNERNGRVWVVRALTCQGKMTLAPSQAGRRQVGESSRRQTFASISG